MNGLVGFAPLIHNCNTLAQRNKLRETAARARVILDSRDMRRCMKEHELTGANGNSPEVILRRMLEDKRTAVFCADLGDASARAPIGISHEEVTFDRDTLDNPAVTVDTLAAVFLHEIAHNKGYEHGSDEVRDSEEWPYFVSNQLEACFLAITSGNYGPDRGAGDVPQANGSERGELARGTKLAPAGGNGGVPGILQAPGGRFARGLFGHSSSRIDGLGLITADRNGSGSARTHEVGGATTTPFTQDCGEGSLLVGFEGWHTNVLTLALGTCQTIADIRNHSSSFHVAGENGSLTGDLFWRRCPYGMAVKRIYTRSGSAVDRVDIECEHIDHGQAQLTTQLALLGNTAAGAWRERCPVGTVMSGLFGRSGGRVDRLGGTCQQVELHIDGAERYVTTFGPQRAAIVEGRGGFGGLHWPGETCPRDQAVIGLNARMSAGNSVQFVQAVCADAEEWSNKAPSVTQATLTGHGTGPSTISRTCPRPSFLAGWDIVVSNEVQAIQAHCVRAED